MDLNDILTLAKAGFTAPQITALLSSSLSTTNPNPNPYTPAPAPAPTNVTPFPTTPIPVSQPAAAMAPATATAPAPAPEPVTASVTETDPYQNIMQQLGLIQNTMQNNALLQAQQPKEQTVDDILAEIINPPVLDQKK